MDTGQAAFGVASLRMGRGSYRDRGMDVFSREASSRAGSEENDEEALTWAALEKLPTIACVRKGINTAGGEVVDVAGLGFQDMRHLLERLVRVAEEDHEQFLRKLRKRLDREHYRIVVLWMMIEHRDELLSTSISSCLQN